MYARLILWGNFSKFCLLHIFFSPQIYMFDPCSYCETDGFILHATYWLLFAIKGSTRWNCLQFRATSVNGNTCHISEKGVATYRFSDRQSKTDCLPIKDVLLVVSTTFRITRPIPQTIRARRGGGSPTQLFLGTDSGVFYCITFSRPKCIWIASSVIKKKKMREKSGKRKGDWK